MLCARKPNQTKLVLWSVGRSHGVMVSDPSSLEKKQPKIDLMREKFKVNHISALVIVETKPSQVGIQVITVNNRYGVASLNDLRSTNISGLSHYEVFESILV